MSSPAKRIVPARGRSSPERPRRVVVLPAPLAPIRRDDAAGFDREIDALHRIGAP